MKYDNIYLNANHLFSYYSGGYRIFIIVGARGRGKSFWAKRYCLKRLFRQKKKFTWIRPTESAVDTLKEFDGYKFYEDIVNANTFNERYDIKISGDGTINYKLFDDSEEDIPFEHAGYLMALSTFHKLKGNTFTEIKTIVFDEFIPEVGEVVRGDRARQFVNTVETICRLSKDTVIIMLANALDKGDRILNLFFQNIKEHGYYFNKEKLACMLYLPDSKEFNDRRFESISGKIIKNTPYEDTIASNKFLSMAEVIVKLLAPMAPHWAEELWQDVLDNETSVHKEAWPEFDPNAAKASEVELAVQVNGKVKAKITVASDAAEDAIRKTALEAIADATAGKDIKKVIIIPGRLVNVVAK